MGLGWAGSVLQEVRHQYLRVLNRSATTIAQDLINSFKTKRYVNDVTFGEFIKLIRISEDPDKAEDLEKIIKIRSKYFY